MTHNGTLFVRHTEVEWKLAFLSQFHGWPIFLFVVLLQCVTKIYTGGLWQHAHSGLPGHALKTNQSLFVKPLPRFKIISSVLACRPGIRPTDTRKGIFTQGMSNACPCSVPT